MDAPVRRLRVEKLSIQADKPVVSLGLECMKILPSLPLSLSLIPFLFFLLLSFSSHCLYLSLSPPSPSLACVPLPACLLLSNTQLISVWRLVVLPAHWSLLLKTERTWDTHVAACQPVCVFWITGVFIHQFCVCACVSESRDRVRSNRDEHWVCFSNHIVSSLITQGPQSMCVYMTHISTYKSTHLDSLLLILRFSYAVHKQCMFHCECVDGWMLG